MPSQFVDGPAPDSGLGIEGKEAREMLSPLPWAVASRRRCRGSRVRASASLSGPRHGALDLGPGRTPSPRAADIVICSKLPFVIHPSHEMDVAERPEPIAGQNARPPRL